MDSVLVSNLLYPECYPHAVTELSLIETHVAWLIKTGAFVYKIKKPVNFGFLDFTTLEQRKFYCEEELRLNQRMSDDLYLEVVSICGTENQPFIGACDRPIEYAVKLKQFEAGKLLTDLVSEGGLDPELLDRLAEKIAEFHLRAPIVSQNSAWGEPESIRQTVEDNYRHIDLNLLCAPEIERLALMEAVAQQRSEQLAPLMRERKALGLVRECHGDLHLGNITLNDEKLLVFDCIEFNLEFRWIDRVMDLAFLLMDLEARGEYRLANRALNRYLETTGDYSGISLLAYYKAHRAMVRAKVAMLGESPDRKSFLHYLSLTERYAEPPVPELILMHGLSGTGKSHLSTQLLEQFGAIRVRSDVERKRIYRQASLKGASLELYGADMNTRTFLRLSEVTEQLIRAGQTVIVDATFIKQRTRRHFIDLAQRYQRPVRIVNCIASDALIAERVTQRMAQGVDPSDADLDVVNQQKIHYEPLNERELEISVAIDTGQPDALECLIRYLQSQELLPTRLI